jgi:hypothetical protein
MAMVLARRLLITAVLLASSLVLAEEPAPPPPSSYAGASITGFLGFLRVNVGSFEVFFEHVFAKRHGLHAAFDFIHVHQNATYQQLHQWTFGGALTYRFYLLENPGPWVGLRLGYRRGFGRFGDPGEPDHLELANSQFSAIGQVGYRFLPLPWLSIAARAGLGYGPYTVAAVGRNDAQSEAVVRLARDVLAPVALVFDSELTVAFAF